MRRLLIGIGLLLLILSRSLVAFACTPPNPLQSGTAYDAAMQAYIVCLGGGGGGLPSITFATLPGSVVNNAVYNCSDCKATNPCTGSGSGAIAYGLAGAWDCGPIGAVPSGVDANSSGQITASHFSAPLPIAQGGRGCGAPTTVSGLISCNTAARGSVCSVTDENAANCAPGTTLTGGGSLSCAVHCDGSAWSIVGTGPPTVEQLLDALVSGPTNGQGLCWNTAASKWENGSCSGSGGTPGGSTGQIQYNNSSAFGGITLIPVANGGKNCGAPVIFASLPGSPTQGTECVVTDAPSCVNGAALTVGGGGVKCNVQWLGTSWMPGGGAASSGSAFPLSGAVSAASHPIQNLATDSTTGDALSRNQSSMSALIPPTGTVPMNTQKFSSMAGGTTAGDSLSFGQSAAQLHDLQPTVDTSAAHTLGNPTGAQFSREGMYNVNDPFWNSACPANTAAAAETCIQAAYEAACTTASGAPNSITPWVYIPWGNYAFGKHGIVRDCANYVPIIGDKPEFASGTRINAGGNFPVFNSATSTEESAAGTLNTTNIATGGVANTAHLWQLASGGGGTAGWYGYDINSVLAKAYGPAPINGLGHLGVRFYMNAAHADSLAHGILNSFSLLNNSAAIDVHFNNTTLTFGLLTGASAGNPNATATGTITDTVNQFVEVDYDGANICVYAGSPGGTATRGTSVAETGNIFQLPYENFVLGEGWPNNSYPMSGVLDSPIIDNQAFHTCASTSSFTAPSAKLTTDANTIFLDTGADSTGALTYANMSTCGTSGTASCWTWPVSYSGGSTNSQYRPTVQPSIIDDQQRPTDVENLQIAGGNESIVEDEHPWAVLKNLDLCPSYAGIMSVNNDFNATDDNIFIDGYDCGNPSYGASYGYWDVDNQGFAYLSRLRIFSGGVIEYAGHSPCYNCEFNPNGATVIPILAYGSGSGQVSLFSPEWDNENGFTGHPDIVDGGGINGISLYDGNFNAPTNEPAIQVAPFSNQEAHINLYGTLLPASGVTPVNVGSLSHTNQPVYVQGFDVAVDQNSPPLLPGQLCNAGANFTQYCSNTGPQISSTPLTGAGSTLAITATTDYMLAQGGPLAVSGTEGNFETVAGANQTITTVACNFTAANGAGNTDTLTFIDVTHACTTAPTCAASNSATCVNASPGSGLCNVSKGDLIVYSDVTTGTPSARSGFCTAS